MTQSPGHIGDGGSTVPPVSYVDIPQQEQGTPDEIHSLTHEIHDPITTLQISKTVAPAREPDTALVSSVFSSLRALGSVCLWSSVLLQ